MLAVAGNIFFGLLGGFAVVFPLSKVYTAAKLDSGEYAPVTLFVMVLGGSGAIWLANLARLV